MHGASMDTRKKPRAGGARGNQRVGLGARKARCATQLDWRGIVPYVPQITATGGFTRHCLWLKPAGRFQVLALKRLSVYRLAIWPFNSLDHTVLAAL
jgi:hypothetical protein